MGFGYVDCLCRKFKRSTWYDTLLSWTLRGQSTQLQTRAGTTHPTTTAGCFIVLLSFVIIMMKMAVVRKDLVRFSVGCGEATGPREGAAPFDFWPVVGAMPIKEVGGTVSPSLFS